MRFPVRLCGLHWARRCSSWRTVNIGDVSARLPHATNKHNIPVNYLTSSETSGTWGILRWLLQKDSLGQDVFLLGPPGSSRRRVIFKYLELSGREAEYVALSADTTDSDLKQYRELDCSEAGWRDQAAVRAATEGRILILDGVERAERNLLPLINNLLENREMHLDDGGFLLEAGKYDRLKQEEGEDKLKEWGMRRVHEGFRVFAIGLPIPPFKGNTLDPPFRSRFQCKSLKFPDYEDALSELASSAPSSSNSLKNLLDLVYTINSPQMRDLGLPFFSFDSALKMAKLLEVGTPFRDALDQVYPTFHLSEEVRKSADDLVAKQVSRRRRGKDGKDLKMDLEVENDLVLSSTLRGAVESMEKSISIGDICIIGNKGSGKTTIARQLAKRFGHEDAVQISLYRDMSGRDVVQSRDLNKGTTVWRDSAIVQAAVKGDCLILDGIDTLDPTVLSSLQSLIFERELWLSDGTKILRHDRWEALGKPAGVRPVHPNFKIIALAEPPKKDSNEKTWLSPEVCSMFIMHHLPPLPVHEETQILTTLVGFPPPEILLKVTHALRTSPDSNMKALGNCLSTRQLQRICRKLNRYPKTRLYDLVAEATLIKFAPQLTQIAFDEILTSNGLPQPNEMNEDLQMDVTDKFVTIGDVVIPRNLDHDAPAKVPSTLYYDNRRQVEQLYRISQDLLLGGHLLLVGNQGVGKNKIIDHLLFICSQPREYMQLHRDTTVASLSVQPQLIDGSIVYQDSALIKALKVGHILILDEADKAPVQVTRVLYSLFTRGEMILADGKRVVSKKKEDCGPNEIPIHPKFQAVVLANRPGFPFMGHDFFPLVCDAFSVHTIDSPDAHSEMALLEKYAPNIPVESLQQLVQLFADLRDLYNSGQISYPFSTRELVSVTKHLSAFPEDGLLQALNNVLDFDSFESNSRKLIGNVVRSHGVPMDTEASDIFLGVTSELGPFQQIAKFTLNWDKKATIEKKPFKYIDQLFLAQGELLPSGSSFPRIDKFTELSQQWRAPFTRIRDLVVSGGQPLVLSNEGRPVIGSLDVPSRTWSMKIIPVQMKDFQGVGIRSQQQGQFLLQDKRGGNLYITNVGQNVMNLTNLPAGELIYRDLNYALVRTKLTELVVLRLSEPFNSYVNITMEGPIELAYPIGDNMICINKNVLINLNDGTSSDVNIPDGLRILNEKLFTSDLHCIGKVTSTPDSVSLSAVMRSSFEGSDEGVALNCNSVTASTMNGNPYGIEYVNLDTNKISRVGLNEKQVLLRSCDTNQGRLYSLERAKNGWMLNMYTLASFALAKELRDWQKTLGSTPRFDSSGPKHGKEDDKEHHGGNTWAGGTGGTDTAGLGGVGGPYRLDKGFDVHQVSDEVKRAVPAHIAEQAKQMAREALARRLQEINMTDSEHNVYKAYLDSVKTSVQALRVIIEGLEGKKAEREWVRHRSEGDIDEGKLVEAAAGERNVFKRRMEPHDKSKGRQEKPKRLILLADVSGSMYRFNGYDGRLERELESVLMMMEALHGFDTKIQYEVRGHSGEECDISFVKAGEAPGNEKERFKVLQRMYAHAQYCLTGDSTLQAIEKSVKELKDCDDYDENCVILLSDANLDRYGIPGRKLAKLMQSREPSIQAYAILIGSLGAQAHMLKQELPPGHAFVCMESKQLPQILKQIFTSKLIAS